MTVSIFLKILKSYLYPQETVWGFMYAFFDTILLGNKDDSEMDVRPFQKESNAGKAKKIYYDERDLSKNDIQYIRSHFDEDAFLALFDDLPGNMQQNLIDELKRYEVDANYENLAEVMCQRFVDLLRDLSEKKKTKKVKSDEHEILNCTTSKEKTPRSGDETLDSARRFCIQYEEQRDLLVLCQIARQIAPLHNHVRYMYTDYLSQGKEVQDAIMHLCDIPLISFMPNWEKKYLEFFREDIKRLQLSTVNDLLYEGGKYFHRARQYSNIKLTDISPKIFPSINIKTGFVTSNKVVELIDYIDDYLYWQENKGKKKAEVASPLDWMIENLDLLNCNEEELVYWVCLFIFCSCYVIPRKYGRKQPDDITFLAPPLICLTTIEDLYYASLLALQNIYSQIE